jgi:parallel beta-helix repeat protein
MVTAHDKARTAFQSKLDSLRDGAALQLVTGEFPGPVVLQRAVTLDGRGATLWAMQGPVLTIAADGVVLRNFKIEVTGDGGDDPEDGCAILVQAPGGVHLENVEVRGSVIGLPEEEGEWRHPLSLWLGQLPSGKEHECLLRLAVPVPCEIVSHITGLEVVPRRLEPGPREVKLRIERLQQDTLLNGTITLTSASLKRSILVSAHVQATADHSTPTVSGAVAWEPPDWAALQAGTPPPRPKPAKPAKPHSVPAVAKPPSTPSAPDTETTPKTMPVPLDVGSATLPLPEQWGIDGSATPSTVVVSPKAGEGHYRTIAEAIKGAMPGSTVQVKPGLYKESLVLTKKLDIVGDGPAAEVVVECGDASCVKMQTDVATLRGLTLRGSAGRGGKERFTVHLSQGQLTLEDCEITSDSLACIGVHGASTEPVVRNCKIHSGKSAGVLVYHNGQGTFEGCDISGHGLAGVEVRDGGNPVFRKCRVHDCKETGILVHDNGRGTFEECDISGNSLANVEVRQGGNPLVKKCKIREGKYPGVRVLDKGAGTFDDCEITANALAGVEIKQNGSPTLRKCQVRDGKQVGVLVLRNGLGTLEECVIAGNALAGVLIKQASDPVLRRCQVHDNGDVGIAVHEKGKGKLEECDVFENALAGVEVRRDAEPKVKRCKLHDGKQAGIVVADEGGGTFDDCDVFANAGPGVMVVRGGRPTLKKCNVRNGKLVGIVVADEGAGSFHNCEVFGNASGGVTLLGGGTPLFRECKITRNGGVGIWADQKGKGTVQGCDLRENKGGATDVRAGVVGMSGNRVDRK